MTTFDGIQQEISNILCVSEELSEDQYVPALNYLEELGIQEQSKVDGIGYAVRKRKAEIEFLKQEEERLRARRKSVENRLQEFKNYLLSILRRYNLKKIKGLSSTLYTRKVQSVIIEDTEEIPEAYKQEVTEVKVDKQGLSKALKDGEEIPGAYLEDKESLTIR